MLRSPSPPSLPLPLPFLTHPCLLIPPTGLPPSSSQGALPKHRPFPVSSPPGDPCARSLLLGGTRGSASAGAPVPAVLPPSWGFSGINRAGQAQSRGGFLSPHCCQRAPHPAVLGLEWVQAGQLVLLLWISGIFRFSKSCGCGPWERAVGKGSFQSCWRLSLDRQG